MADVHFSRDSVGRFLRAELSREEARDFVRHLLRQCPECSRLLEEISQRQDFRFLIQDLEDASLRFDPDPYKKMLRKTFRFVEQEEVRAGPRTESHSRASLR